MSASERVLTDLAYGPHGARNHLDLYLPDASWGRPVPVVIWIHGGGWRHGSKKGGGYARRLVARGYAVAAIAYRLSDDAPFPAQVVDCRRAVRWLRAHAGEYGLDVGRIAAWGASAGGHLAALLGTAPDAFAPDEGDPWQDLSAAVSAVVAFCPPTDLTIAGELIGGETADGPVTRLLSAAPGDRAEAARRASPLAYVDAGAAPFFIVHGTADEVVFPAQSERLHAALRGAGVESTLRLLEGAGHHHREGFDQRAPDAEIDRFLDRYLRAEPAASDRR
jgi:acetyl esterase/lipase